VQSLDLIAQTKLGWKNGIVLSIVGSQKGIQGRHGLGNQSQDDLRNKFRDLNDMVEQGSAYKVMVEDLSDPVLLSLEEELVTLQ
jgi:hypothetical protein